MKDTEMNKRIGYEMRTQRLIRRMTLSQMAERMGVASKNTISLMELGKKQISVVDLRRYCNILDVNYFDVLRKAEGDSDARL